MATSTRLFVTDSLAPDALVALSADQAHYLRSVLRLQPGASVLLFNGRDGEWRGSLESVGKGRASVKVLEMRRDQTASPDLWLLYAPIKRAQHDFVVQKAVELGVSRLAPVLTRRTQVERIKEQRVEATAIEAAEQCERLDIPTIDPPQSLERRLDAWPPDRWLLVCAEAGQAPPMADVLRQTAADGDGARSKWAVLIGPEGGFSDAELETLRHLPFVKAGGLGPRILRAETATLAALAVWQSVLGDWNDRPPDRGGD